MILALILICCVLLFISRKFVNYRWHWSKKGVKQVPVVNDVKSLFERKSFHEMVRSLYQQFPDERYIGAYQFFKPILVLRDPGIIRQMVVKDFDHFTDHFKALDGNCEPLIDKSLFSLDGNKWRHMRATLSPAFTGSKMKAMFHLMVECAQQFTKNFEEKDEDVIEVDLKDIFSRYAIDVIGSCAFGVQCDSLKNRDNQFYLMGREATNFTGLWRTIRLMIIFVVPKFARLFGLKIFSKRVSAFFINLVQGTVDYREKNKIVRPDMIHLLMEARKGVLKYVENQNALKETGFATVEESTIGTSSNIPKQEYTMLDMTSQAVLFFNAGFDTTSIVMSFMAYELCLNPDVQQKLYNEIQQVIENTDGNINYEDLNNMKYLDMVITETLRKWPFIPTVDRECTLPYTIKPEKDSEVPVNLVPKDLISVPVFGIHYDPQYYPNPNRFDPERFSDENKHNIKPYTYLPFGVGPRNCIGSRFALLEIKIMFVHFLSKYELIVTEKTPIPLVLSKYSIVLAPEKNFIVGLKKRSNDELITTKL